MKTYFFKIADKPAFAFDINLAGIVTDDIVNDYHYQKMADNYAKFLCEMTGQEIKHYAKGSDKIETTAMQTVN